MLCSDTNLIGGAKFYTDFAKWHLSQSEAVERLVINTPKKTDLASCGWKSMSQHVQSFLKPMNVLEGNAFVNGLHWTARKRKLLSVLVKALIDSQFLY